jgi:hypothetical protein
MVPYFSSSSPLMLDRWIYCNRADTHWYTMDKVTPLDHPKPPKQARFPDAQGRTRTHASKLVAGDSRSAVRVRSSAHLFPARHIPCGCRRHRRGEGGSLALPRPCAPRVAPTLSLQASSVLSCRILLEDNVFHRNLGTRFGSSSAKRVGLSVCVSSVCAAPSSMISASSWPIAGECITPWPEEPLAR